MARFIRALQRSANQALTSSSPCAAGSGRLASGAQLGVRSWTAPSSFPSRVRTYGNAVAERMSPMEANLLRRIVKQREHLMDSASRFPLPTEIGAFDVMDNPGEQQITLTRKYGENEDIRIEASTFDCCVAVPLTGLGPLKGEERYHITLRIHITKGEGSNPLKIICSSWPEFLEFQRLLVESEQQHRVVKPYIGRYFGFISYFEEALK
uniref:Uncharacterized protein n=1 Tax=Kalanchoe fedtschenkoi TaxID=63787 RepID=A0A7N0U869_KALFE